MDNKVLSSLSLHDNISQPKLENVSTSQQQVLKEMKKHGVKETLNILQSSNSLSLRNNQK